jgi:hypothetical protein
VTNTLNKPWKDWTDDELADDADTGTRGQGAVVESTRRFRASSDSYSRRMLCLTIVLAVLTLVQVIAVVPVIKGWFNPKAPPTQSQRNLDAEAAPLQLSQTCSAAADTFWRRGGYDHPPTPAKGTTENWGYQSHYSTEQKRCFVLVGLLTHLPSGGSTQHQEVFDAIEGGEPLAILNIYPGAAFEAPRRDLLKANTSIPSTPENLEWFRGLMSR